MITYTNYLKLNDCWLNNFNKESIQGDFNHPGPRIHPKTTVRKKIASTGKTRTIDVQKKEAYDANNARNRDLYGFAKVNNLLNFSDGKSINTESVHVSEFDKKNDLVRSSNHQEVENALISYIDEKAVRASKKEKSKK